MNSVLFTVQVWHSRATPPSYLKSLVIRDNTDTFFTRLRFLLKFVPVDPTLSTLPQEVALFFATLRNHYFAERSMWNVSFGCQCVCCRDWGSSLERTSTALLFWNIAHLKKK